jgi:hypothetical protein
MGKGMKADMSRYERMFGLEILLQGAQFEGY